MRRPTSEGVPGDEDDLRRAGSGTGRDRPGDSDSIGAPALRRDRPAQPSGPVNWLQRTTPVPHWALLCFYVLTVNGAVEMIGWVT